MTKKIIAGNWKMNGTKAENSALVFSILERLKSNITSDVQVIFFPPFVYLQQVNELFAKARHFVHSDQDEFIVGARYAVPFHLGAQNLSQYLEGAYTGEISAKMLKDIGCEYVLVGHSERRHIFNETNEIIAEKFNQAIQNNLIPILCVGETRQERDQHQTTQVIQSQIETIISKIRIQAFQSAIIAYEPVWAIGTGVNATPEQAQLAHQFIRKLLATHDKKLANNISILYGGSIKPGNAKSLFIMPDINGGLVGGASLDAKQFLDIYHSLSL